MNKGKIAFANPVSAAKIALMIVATIAVPPSHISTITKLTINILNQYIKFNVKWVIFYTLIFHEENNKVAIIIDSFMRKIAYNEFINFYKILIINKLRDIDIDIHKRIYKTDTYNKKTLLSLP